MDYPFHELCRVHMDFIIFTLVIDIYRKSYHCMNPSIYKIKRFIISPLKYFVGLIVSYCLVIILLGNFYPLPDQISYSCTILSKDGQLMRAFLSEDEKWRLYTEMEEITPELKKAFVFKEDRFFYFHPGVNPFAIIRAIINNIKEGHRTSGASTISMQVARLLEPKERTYCSKLAEIFRALQLELKYTKEEILQLYLNIIPFGSNIEGVKSASVIYFGKMPDHLSIGEIAALSIIPNRPVTLRLGKNNETIIIERNKWLLRYKRAGLFDDKYIDDALEEPLTAYRREIPKLCPHLALKLKNNYPSARIIRTNLNAEIQLKTEKIVGDYSRRLYFQNIRNAMALVVDNMTHEIVAYIGSADFNNNEDGGQVDGITAIRSPGSTLKPLLYGIAFDQGLITPKTIIADVPVSFSGYEPENYDEKFYGAITAEYALASSLNIPAVKILEHIQPRLLIEKLVNADFKQVRKDKENLGLSMILGGCGVTLEELTGLYCTFANNGEFTPLKYVSNDHNSLKSQIISPGAVFIITEILTQLKRPDLPLNWDNSVHTPKIAWKTGTSYGRRDAWSIGYNKKYTIGVWVGNFSGVGVPELNGTDKATPLLFQLFNTVDYDSEKEWFSMTNDIELRYVCSQTGLIPGELCSDLIIDYFKPGVSSTMQCSHLKKVFVNADSSLSYCSVCLPEIGYKKAIYPNYSPEMITYYDNNNINYKRIPLHNPDCERLLDGAKPKITSPIDNNEYFVNVLDSMQILLSSHVANDVNRIYWYINYKFYKEVSAGERLFFVPGEGKNDITCTDDKGRSTDIRIFVKYTNF
jgi:penicillin-binding protein 1C